MRPACIHGLVDHCARCPITDERDDHEPPPWQAWPGALPVGEVAGDTAPACTHEGCGRPVEPGVPCYHGEPAPCPVCKDRTPTPEPNYGGGWDLCCSNCFDADCVGDPPEYVTSCIQGSGGTKAEAIDDWNWKVSEYEPRVKGGR
jgi:hypothetical protein